MSSSDTSVTKLCFTNQVVMEQTLQTLISQNLNSMHFLCVRLLCHPTAFFWKFVEQLDQLAPRLIGFCCFNVSQLNCLGELAIEKLVQKHATLRFFMFGPHVRVSESGRRDIAYQISKHPSLSFTDWYTTDHVSHEQMCKSLMHNRRSQQKKLFQTMACKYRLPEVVSRIIQSEHADLQCRLIESMR